MAKRLPFTDKVLREHPYRSFFAIGVFAFLIATIGFETTARIAVRDQGLLQALTESGYYAAVQPIGTVLLLLPFLLLSWMTSSLAKRTDLTSGLVLLLSGLFLLCALYLPGQIDSQRYMEQRMWTAATLSVGLLPLKSILILVVCLITRWLIVRKRQAADRLR